MSITIRLAKKNDCYQIACLHKDGIVTGFLSTLGIPFLKELYNALSKAPGTVVFVAINNQNTVVGFVAASKDIKKTYRWVFLHKGVFLLVHVMGRLLKFSNVKKILQTLLYPKKINKQNKNESKNKSSAELLSIAVDKSVRGQKIGYELVNKLDLYFKEEKINSYKVVTTANDDISNAFYKKCGFTFTKTFVHHENKMNEYAKILLPNSN